MLDLVDSDGDHSIRYLEFARVLADPAIIDSIVSKSKKLSKSYVKPMIQ